MIQVAPVLVVLHTAFYFACNIDTLKAFLVINFVTEVFFPPTGQIRRDGSRRRGLPLRKLVTVWMTVVQAPECRIGGHDHPALITGLEYKNSILMMYAFILKSFPSTNKVSIHFECYISESYLIFSHHLQEVF